MRALLCKSHGLPESLVVEELPSPLPGPGQLVVDVKAAGVNFPDALIIQNKYQLKARAAVRAGGRAGRQLSPPSVPA